MYTDLSPLSTVQRGLGVSTNDLLIYYDLSNPKSYSGTGNTITNLIATYPEISGSLFNSPSYTSNGVRSYIAFSKASSQYLKFNIRPLVGPDYTSLAVISSPTSTWDDNGWIAGGVKDSTADNVASITYAFSTTRNASNNALVDVIAYDYELPFGSYGNRYTYTQSPSADITTPNLHFNGYSGNDGFFYAGFNQFVAEQAPTSGNGNRGAVANANGYIARVDPSIGTSYTSVRLYMYLFYNRKLPVSELSLIYQSIKTRFNIA